MYIIKGRDVSFFLHLYTQFIKRLAGCRTCLKRKKSTTVTSHFRGATAVDFFIEYASFPVLSFYQYSKLFQPSAWQSDIPAYLFLLDGTQHRTVSSEQQAD